MSLYDGTLVVSNKDMMCLGLRLVSIDISVDCQTVMTFYATSLPSVVGPQFKAPDVVYLARKWLDTSSALLPCVQLFQYTDA